MAKKKNVQNKKNKTTESLPENALPQNIVPIGERVEENKNIYIAQNTYKKIHKFTQNKTTDESGGILVGSVIEELGKTNILICGFVEAKYCDATPTTLKFTHETWEYIHKEMEKKYPGKKIVGWIHTHPDFGIFLSEYDKFIHENFFSEQNQVAYVIDPIQKIEGFYFWINEKLERCKGFYIYDRTGVSIDIDVNEDNDAVQETKKSSFSFKNILIGILSVAVVFLLFSHHSLNKEIEKLKQQSAAQTASINSLTQYLQYLMYMQPPYVPSEPTEDTTETSDVIEDTTDIIEPESETPTEGDNTGTTEAE